ncbi:MAG: metal-dependent hydrolase [Trueperaceae bacterium]|nr:metal-dependent hydrolase [Trueperaceae bacterium]
MRAVTHLSFAGLVAVIASGFGAEPGLTGAAALAAGSLLPDIDSQHSGLGRMVKPLSGKLERRFGHRTLTHSFLGMGIFALGFSWLILINPVVLIWLLLGMLTHILLDTANIVGVPLLYPWRLQFWLVANRAWRVPYNSPQEFTWLGVISLLAVCLVPMSLDGFSPWFHRALGTPYGAVEDYLQWREDYEVWADIKGHNLLTDEDVDGRYLIIDAVHDDELLVEDGSGRAFTVGLSQSANIHSKRLAVWKGKQIVASTYRLELSGRLVSDLIASLPEGAKSVHINAALKLKGEADTAPVVGYFERIQKNGDEFSLRSATAGDLAPLAHMVIEGGSAVIRAEYSPGTEVLADLNLINSIPRVKSHILNIPDLPGLAGLLIEVGDEVKEGQLIARYIDDDAIAVSVQELEKAEAELPRLEATLKLEQAAYNAKIESLEQAINDAQNKRDRIAYLVGCEAEAQIKLIEAEADLRKANEAVLGENTRWTSEKMRLEQQIQDARLSIATAARTQQMEMEHQWVKAPVAGLVSDIRLVGVSIKGIDLEVMILEK